MEEQALMKAEEVGLEVIPMVLKVVVVVVHPALVTLREPLLKQINVLEDQVILRVMVEMAEIVMEEMEKLAVIREEVVAVHTQLLAIELVVVVPKAVSGLSISRQA